MKPVNRTQRPSRAALALVSSLAFIAAGPVAGAAERSLSLEDATRMALEKNERIAIERQSVQAARAGMSAAGGAYDPVLAFGAGWQRSDDPASSSPQGESATGDISVGQLLPTGGRLSLRSTGLRLQPDAAASPSSVFSRYRSELAMEFTQPLLRDRSMDPARLASRVASASRDGATASLRQVVQETIAAVEDAYWSLVQARQEIGVREESVRLAEEQLGETRSRVESGAAPETEIAEPRAELETRRGALLASREAASRAESALKFLILGDSDPLWPDTLTPTDDVVVEGAAPDVETAMARALELRPELDAAGATLRRRRAETAFAANRVMPSLDAVASYTRFGFAQDDFGGAVDDLGNGDRHDARLGLAFELPLGNRAARAERREARSAEEQAAFDLTRLRKAIRVEILDAAARLGTAEARITAARAAREAAEIQLAAERDRYGAGKSTNFLVLTRQNELSRARLDEIAARTDYRRARTEMARATGSLAAERGIDPGQLMH